MSYLINPYILGEALPVTDVYARYTADSFSGTTWSDISGNGKNATVTRGTVSKVSTTGNGASKTFNVLQGGTGDGILFPSDVLPSTYTLFHVTRYSGANRGRVVTGLGNNWLSGHWSEESGVAYHEGWITVNSIRDAFQNNWVISTDQISLYRGNGLTYGTSGGTATTRLSVNAGQYAEYSDWQCAEIIVYNRTLSSTEYQQVEGYLSRKYGLGISDNVVPTDEFLFLDAANTSSYPGSGTIWYDISGNSRNFNIVSTAYNSSGPKYMDFNGSYGMAKNSSDLSISGEVTYCVWTRPKTSTAEWRTLTRSYVSDHHVIIQSGAYNIGMYDNDGAAFLGTGYLQTSLPGWNTGQWNFMCWRWETGEATDYILTINDSPNVLRGTINNDSARYNRGFGSIGGYHGGNTTPSSGSQYWGDISQFIVYNRYITDTEVVNIYNNGASRHGL